MQYPGIAFLGLLSQRNKNPCSHKTLYMNVKNSFLLLLFYLFIYLFAVLGLELRAYTLSHSTALFCDWCFRNRVSGTLTLAGFEPRSS
jgi:hypothetical protein